MLGIDWFEIHIDESPMIVAQSLYGW